MFDALPLDIRFEKLTVSGNDVAAQRSLLVAQRALQLIRRDAGGLDLVRQLASQDVGAIHQRRANQGAGQQRCSHHR